MIILGTLSITLKYSDYIKNRYHYIFQLNSKEKILEFAQESIYFKIIGQAYLYLKITPYSELEIKIID